MVPAFCRNSGALKACRPCTYDGNSPGYECLLESRAGRRQQCVLNAANRLARISVGDANIGASANSNAAFHLSFELGQNLRVTNMRAGHSDHIGLASREDIFRMHRINDTTHRKHRQSNDLAYCRREVNEDAVRCRRRGPMFAATQMRDIGMGDDVEIVNQARFGQT